MPDVCDRLIIGERTYDFVSGVERFRERMKQYFPRDARAVDRYIAGVQSTVKASSLYFAEKVIPLFLSRIAGGLLRFPFMRRAGRTTASVLDELTDNRELKGVLTGQWGDYGLPPGQSSFGIHAIIANHYFDGSAYPVGGAGRIVETVAPVIAEQGGQIMINAPVKKILIEGEKATGVLMEDGQLLRTGIVISNVGARNTVERLIPSDHAALVSLKQNLQKITHSMAHFCLYVGVRQTAEALGLEGTNLWVHSDYDHDAAMARFTADPAAPFPFQYISFPSAKDPDFVHRYPERATIEIVTPAPYAWFAQWEESRWKKRPQDYEDFKQRIADRLAQELERQVPALAGKLDFTELSTPLTTQHFMHYAQGEIYGLAATPERFRIRGLTPRHTSQSLLDRPRHLHPRRDRCYVRRCHDGLDRSGTQPYVCTHERIERIHHPESAERKYVDFLNVR